MELAHIQHANQRVLTTTQIAEAYSVESKALMRNFQRNKEKFLEGTHYYALSGEELKRFKGGRQNDATLKFVSVLYLWTEQGAFLLAKSLSTESAWAAYSLLTNQYFELSQQHATPALPYDAERFAALENRVKEIEQQLHQVTLHSGEQKRLQRAVGERVYKTTVKQSERNNLFRAIYSALKDRYQVGSYRDIKQHQLQDALRFIAHWEGRTML